MAGPLSVRHAGAELTQEIAIMEEKNLSQEVAVFVAEHAARGKTLAQTAADRIGSPIDMDAFNATIHDRIGNCGSFRYFRETEGLDDDFTYTFVDGSKLRTNDRQTNWSLVA